LPRVRVVLVRPETPANVGAAARIVRNAGLESLCLVAPGDWRTVECWRTAWGAHEVLEQAAVFADLSAALAGCAYVAGMSGRREPGVASLDVREMAAELAGLGADERAALVFGPGIAFTALYVAAVSLLAAPAALAGDSDFKLDPNTAQMFTNAGYLILVSGVMLASILVLSASTAALRTGVLPAWLGWTGLVVAVIMLFAVFFIPILIFVAWVLVVSLLMVVTAWRVRGNPPPPTTTAVG